MTTQFPANVHIMAAGGAAMSAIARVLHSRGVTVTGCDVRTSPNVEQLQALGIPVTTSGHSPDHLAGVEMLLWSAANRQDEPELVAAREQGIPALIRGDAVGLLLEGYRILAVAGTHGKTTTSSMCTHILAEAGYDPFFLVGGEVRNLGTSARAGSGEWAVIEADEFADAFLAYNPEVGVILNVEEDHLNYFGSLERIRQSFRRFAANTTGTVVVCGDDAEARAAVSGDGPAIGAALTYYGTGDVEWRATGIAANQTGGSDFELSRRGERLGGVATRIPGEHNVLNATAAIAATVAAGVPFATARDAIGGFLGAGLRFERVGEARGILIIEDYAHHPTEVAALLRAGRQQFPDRRLVILFQPHTYSRTAYVFDKFTRCFEGADAAFLMATDGDRERPDEGRTTEDLVAHVTSPAPVYVVDFDDMVRKLGGFLEPGDVLFIVGAGNIKKAGPIMLEALQR